MFGLNPYESEELEAEYNARFDYYREAYGPSQLDPEYEAYCDSGCPDYEAWIAFRKGEQVDRRANTCTECRRPIPETDDCIEWQDGSGFICEKCADANEAAADDPVLDYKPGHDNMLPF